jgi:predicted O-methyltransferase YrrM
VIKKKLIPGQVRFSFIFVDGLHTPEGVTIDFDLASRTLHKGGIVVFDDYFGPEFQDYARAIDRLVEAKGIELQIDKANKLVYFTNIL